MEGKKKYLYMDRFEKHQTEDAEWKKNATSTFKGFKDKVDSLVWIVVVSCCLAMAALLVSVIK